MEDIIDEEIVKEFRGIIWKGHPKAIKDKKSINLKIEVNGDKHLLDTCSVEQSGETVAKAHGHGKDACKEALEDFEELVKIQNRFSLHPNWE